MRQHGSVMRKVLLLLRQTLIWAQRIKDLDVSLQAKNN